MKTKARVYISDDGMLNIIKQQDQELRELKAENEFLDSHGLYSEVCRLEEYQRWADAEITKLNKQLKEKDTEIKKLQSPTYVNKLCAVERRLICKKIREEIDNEYPMLLPDSMKVVYKILENVEIK